MCRRVSCLHYVETSARLLKKYTKKICVLEQQTHVLEQEHNTNRATSTFYINITLAILMSNSSAEKMGEVRVCAYMYMCI